MRPNATIVANALTELKSRFTPESTDVAEMAAQLKGKPYESLMAANEAAEHKAIKLASDGGMIEAPDFRTFMRKWFAVRAALAAIDGNESGMQMLGA